MKYELSIDSVRIRNVAEDDARKIYELLNKYGVTVWNKVEVVE